MNNFINLKKNLVIFFFILELRIEFLYFVILLYYIRLYYMYNIVFSFLKCFFVMI